MAESINDKTAVKLTLKQFIAIAGTIITLALYINGQYAELEYRLKTLETNYSEYQLKQVPMMLYNMESMSQDIKLIKEYIIPTTTVTKPNEVTNPNTP